MGRVSLFPAADSAFVALSLSLPASPAAFDRQTTQPTTLRRRVNEDVVGGETGSRARNGRVTNSRGAKTQA